MCDKKIHFEIICDQYQSIVTYNVRLSVPLHLYYLLQIQQTVILF